MVYSFLFPNLSENVNSGRIVFWKKKKNSYVEKGEIICDLKVDNKRFEIESPVSGKLIKHLKFEGDMVNFGEEIALIDDSFIPKNKNVVSEKNDLEKFNVKSQSNNLPNLSENNSILRKEDFQIEEVEDFHKILKELKPKKKLPNLLDDPNLLEKDPVIDHFVENLENKEILLSKAKEFGVDIGDVLDDSEKEDFVSNSRDLKSKDFENGFFFADLDVDISKIINFRSEQEDKLLDLGVFLRDDSFILKAIIDLVREDFFTKSSFFKVFRYDNNLDRSEFLFKNDVFSIVDIATHLSNFKDERENLKGLFFSIVFFENFKFNSLMTPLMRGELGRFMISSSDDNILKISFISRDLDDERLFFDFLRKLKDFLENPESLFFEM